MIKLLGCASFIVLIVLAGCNKPASHETTNVDRDHDVSVSNKAPLSAYYLEDDVNYFPHGPEFALQREAEALRAARERRERRTIGRLFFSWLKGWFGFFY